MWMERTCGDLEVIIEKLNESIPMSGPCENRYGKNKKLDRFRRAQNVVHDIFNNGLMNLYQQVSILGVRKRDLPLYVSNSNKWDLVEDRIAEQFRKIVMDAVLEQYGKQGYLDVMHNRSSDIINKAINSGEITV